MAGTAQHIAETLVSQETSLWPQAAGSHRKGEISSNYHHIGDHTYSNSSPGEVHSIIKGSVKLVQEASDNFAKETIIENLHSMGFTLVRRGGGWKAELIWMSGGKKELLDFKGWKQNDRGWNTECKWVGSSIRGWARGGRQGSSHSYYYYCQSLTVVKLLLPPNTVLCNLCVSNNSILTTLRGTYS